MKLCFLYGGGAAAEGGSCRSGWITFPFIAVSAMGLGLAGSGWLANQIVYLIQEFNIKSIDAAQIWNVLMGSTYLFSVIVAIIADSYMGNFSVIYISSLLSLLGMVLYMLTATLDSLRPKHCEPTTTKTSAPCEGPSRAQFAVLYTAIALTSIGFGGSRFTIATMGADQFEHSTKDQALFFNWFFFIYYLSSTIGFTVIVYVEDNVSWGVGFGLCMAANLVGAVFFVLGRKCYRFVKPKGSPFAGLARVVVAACVKRKMVLSTESKDYYNFHEEFGEGSLEPMRATLTSRFRVTAARRDWRTGDEVADVLMAPKSCSHAVVAPQENLFLNRAALMTETDIISEVDRSVSNHWRLATVQHVEDLKILIKIFPLWTTNISLSISIGFMNSLVVLQALTMNRRISPNFKVPAGTLLVFTFISSAIALSLFDHFLLPLAQRIIIINKTPTPLQRIGFGHVMNIIGMAISALIESRRLSIVRSQHVVGQSISVVPMSALWLLVPLGVIGFGEAFHFPGQVALYYHEFPRSLRSTATAMSSLVIALGFYLSTVALDMVRKITKWLPNDINHGRVDKVFWVLVVPQPQDRPDAALQAPQPLLGHVP
ncbi:hypothetical protein Sjap_013390 [Stephania japonica]|uniref:Uncharacterized protein n=1 Tax=Stephania japonica TaxID=461633 RepID=A0AAP0NYK0_9MAGN